MRNSKKEDQIHIGYLEESPFGRIYLAVSVHGLCKVSSESQSITQFAEEVEEIYPDMEIIFNNDYLSELITMLDDYFSGEHHNIDFPLDLNSMSPFGEKILMACSKVGYGETVSYGELALRAGSPGASRAVGTVMSKNPLPIVIPCHRVISASGNIGGYTGGLHKKRLLMAIEGINVN